MFGDKLVEMEVRVKSNEEPSRAKQQSKSNF